MPTYTYKCLPQEHLFEARQKFTDDRLTECPECGGEVRRVINSVGIVFKGKGFYVTDNRSGSGKGSGTAASGEPKAEAKSESKGEGKAEGGEKKSAETTTAPKEKPKAKEKS